MLNHRTVNAGLGKICFNEYGFTRFIFEYKLHAILYKLRMKTHHNIITLLYNKTA